MKAYHDLTQEDLRRKEQERGGSPRRNRFDHVCLKWGITAFLVIAAGILFYYLVFHVSNIKANLSVLTGILMPVVFGFVMAYLLTPILNFIEFRILIPLCNRCGVKESPRRASLIRGGGILITAFLFFAVIYVLIAMMLSQIVPSIRTIINNSDTYINNMTRWVNQIIDDNPELRSNVLMLVNRYSSELENWLNGLVLPNMSTLIRTISMSVLGGVKVIWNFIIGFIISIYLLASKEKFAGQAKKISYACLSRSTANQVIESFRFTHRTFIGFISGKILDSAIIGVLCFIGTSLLGTPYAVLVSVIVGVTNIIPFFGPYLGAIPSTLLIFVVDPMHPLNCVYFVLFILVLQQFDGNFLGPKIIGNSTGLTGFWVIFAITLFGGLFGILGMIVGVPIFAVFYAAVKSLVNAALGRKALPQGTESYMTVGSVDEGGVFHEYVPEYKRKRERLQEKRAEKRREREAVEEPPVEEPPVKESSVKK